MALQDNFNAIYNKKTQDKKQKEELKAHDIIFENKLQDDLQTLQLDYIISNDKKTLIIPKIKNDLIDEVIKTQYDPINKKSKYINKEVQKAYLIKKYDIITNKTIRISKNIEELQKEKETEAIQKQIENETIVDISKKPKNAINWGNIQTIILYVIIAPFAILWGFLEGCCKSKNKKRRF